MSYFQKNAGNDKYIPRYAQTEKLTNTTNDVEGSCADNRRREGTAAHRLWPEVSTAEWKGIPALAAKEMQWLKRAPAQLRVRQVSVEARWERRGSWSAVA